MLKNFVLSPKTAVIFGDDSHLKIVDEIVKQSKRCLIHHDSGAYIMPLVNEVKDNLTQRGCEVFELGGVVPNPRLSLIYEGAKMCKEQDIDFVLAIGGGSVMDSAKFIAFGAKAEFDIWTYKSFTPFTHEILPHAAISTLPGTGSEVSSASMIFNDLAEKPIKGHFTHNDFRFDYVAINPSLSFTLPPKQTAAGAMDIISHSMEGYFSNTEYSYLLDGYMETVIKTVMKNTKVALKDPNNYDARGNLWLASLMPMESYVTASTQPDWVVHNIEKPITTITHGTHGVTLGILTVAWMKYMYKKNIDQFVRFAVNCMGVDYDMYDKERTVLEGINRFEDWLKCVGLPTRFTEIGVKEDVFEDAAELALKVAGFKGRDGHIGMISKLSFDEMIEIYKIAK